MADALATSRRIVLTGGPGAGKTTITRLLAERWPERFVAVAESATTVYTALNTRWDRLDLAGRRRVQREIYRNQLQQEAVAQSAVAGRTLLLDRGTVDGAAYWPDGPEAYWSELGTTTAAELARYDRVLLLETAAALGIYDGHASNAVRFEDTAAAVRAGEALVALWSAHARYEVVPARETFEEKLEAVAQLLGAAAR